MAFLLQDSVSSSDLKAEVLGYTKILAICAKEHPAAGKEKFDIRDFQDQTVIIPLHDCSYRMEFEKTLTRNRVEPSAKMKVNSLEIVKNMVLNGTGIALVPEMAIAEEVEQDKISILPWPEPGGYETCILMIVHKDKWISPYLQTFMEMTRDYFGTTFAAS